MILTPRLQHAINLAATLHRSHTRIGEQNTPYITHLISVAILVNHYGGDEDMIIAGLLHDTVEDVPEYTIEQLELDCGKEVARIVKNLTEPREFHPDLHKTEKWITSKKAYLSQISGADHKTLIVSAADKLHNMQTLIDGYLSGDEILVQRFTGDGLKGQIWFCEEVATILEGKIPEEMFIHYRATLDKLDSLYTPETIR
jgi:(p)ppGpp synthase/HD superfamily hydrolase